MEDKNLELLDSITILYLYNENNYDESLKVELSKSVKKAIFADNVDSALDIISKNDIDILISDFDVNDYLSSLPARMRHINPSCTIIVYTHNQEPNHFLKAIDLKVDKYLLVPTSTEEFMNIIASCADNAFTLKSLHALDDEITNFLNIESYDTLNNCIDTLRDAIASLSQRYGADAIQDITMLKQVLDGLKSILKNSL